MACFICVHIGVVLTLGGDIRRRPEERLERGENMEPARRILAWRSTTTGAGVMPGQKLNSEPLLRRAQRVPCGRVHDGVQQLGVRDLRGPIVIVTHDVAAAVAASCALVAQLLAHHPPSASKHRFPRVIHSASPVHEAIADQ